MSGDTSFDLTISNAPRPVKGLYPLATTNSDDANAERTNPPKPDSKSGQSLSIKDQTNAESTTLIQKSESVQSSIKSQTITGRSIIVKPDSTVGASAQLPRSIEDQISAEATTQRPGSKVPVSSFFEDPTEGTTEKSGPATSLTFEVQDSFRTTEGSPACTDGADLQELLEGSVNEMLKYVYEVKKLNDTLNGLENDDSLASEHPDPEMAFEIENLKQAFREAVLLSDRFIASSKSLASYVSNEEQICQIKEDLAASSFESVEPYLEGIITHMKKCNTRLKQHQPEYKNLAEKMQEFISRMKSEEGDGDSDGLILVGAPKPNGARKQVYQRSFSEDLTRFVSRTPISYITQLFSNTAVQAMNAMPRREIQNTVAKLEKVHELIIQHLKNIALLCVSLSKAEEELRYINHKTVTFEQIHHINARMKDILEITW